MERRKGIMKIGEEGRIEGWRRGRKDGREKSRKVG